LFVVEGLCSSDWFQPFSLEDLAETETVIFVFSSYRFSKFLVY